MRKITYTIGFVFALLATSNAVAQQGFGTNTPDKSSAIEIKSTNKGLLIPRIDLKSTTDQTTISNPANSLLVYNDGLALPKGYYYWSTAAMKWISFVDANNQKNVTVTEDGQNLDVTPTTTGNTTDYKVKIVPGTDKQFLATKMVGATLQTVWVDYSEIASIIKAENGVKRDGDKIKLGGDLTEHTTIDTKTFDLFIKGLSATTDMTNKVIAVGDATTGKVEVATPQTIVATGVTNVLDSAGNIMTSNVSGKSDTAPIINSNNLSIDTTVSSTTLKSSVNTISSSIDLKSTIQAGQVKYEVTAGTGVTIDPTGSTADFKTFKVNAAAGGIVMGGDVTGAANANEISKIQGINVNAKGVNAPTSNQVLKYDGSAWTPATLTTADVTDGKALTSTSIKVPASNKALLEALNIEIKPGTAGQVLTTTGTVGNEITTWADQSSLVAVANGIKKDTDNKTVILGGKLTQTTEIKTGLNSEGGLAANTLAISGLVAPAGFETDKIMIVEDNGTLRSVTRSLSVDVNANYTVSSISGYNTNVQEINIQATIGTVDFDITLPAASLANKGQVVNINIANTNDPNKVVNIKEGATLLTYGGMPYQGWIVKSNGTNWVIVGRN